VPVIPVNKVADEKRIIGKKVAEEEANNLGSQPPKIYSCKFRYDDYKKTQGQSRRIFYRILEPEASPTIVSLAAT
jgi:hypothetical protein